MQQSDKGNKKPSPGAKEAELGRGLKNFEKVWARVNGAKSPQRAAAGQGVQLMPGKQRKKPHGPFQGGR